MRSALLALAAVLALLPVSPAQAKKGAVFGADHPLLGLLTNTSLARGREHRALLVHPIVAESADPEGVSRPLTSVEALKKEALTVAEPEKKAGRGPVELLSWSTEPILLLAGEVLDGGTRDRFLARDVLLRPRNRVVAPAYIGDQQPRPKADRKRELEPCAALAPDLLRLVGITDGPPSAASAFLSDHFGLAGLKAERQTLCRLFTSEKLAAKMGEYRTIFEAIPDESESRTVGVAALVGDRLVGIDLFPTNASLRAHWPKLLATLALQASLHEAAHGLMAQPFPGGRDPDRRKLELKGILKKPYAATVVSDKPVDLGSEIRLAKDEIVGRALVHEGRVVHAVLMVNYLEVGLDEKTPTGTSELSPGELERREKDGLLTDAEKRWLDWFRKVHGPRTQLPGGSAAPRGPGK